MENSDVMQQKIITKGSFISVEGIDGAGKSTHLEFIGNYLKDKGIDSIVTREPGGTEVGEMLRDILLHSRHSLHHLTELLLMFASRQELIHNIIVPHLERGVWVIADRFIDASIAYQGVGRKIGIDKVRQIASLLEPNLQTDITFLFDVTLATALRRVAKDGKQDRIEREEEGFFASIKQAYLELAKAEPQRIKILNTDKTKEETRSAIGSYLDTFLAQKQLVTKD